MLRSAALSLAVAALLMWGAGASRAADTGAPLSPGDYASVERSYGAGATSEKTRHTAANIRRYRAGCRAAKVVSPLARAVRASCLTDADATAAGNSEFDCRPSRAACQRSLDRQARAWRVAMRGLRRMNVAVRKAVTDAKCRRVMLVSAADLRILDRYARATRTLATVYRSKNSARIAAAARALKDISFAGTVDNRERLKAFRAQCR